MVEPAEECRSVGSAIVLVCTLFLAFIIVCYLTREKPLPQSIGVNTTRIETKETELQPVEIPMVDEPEIKPMPDLVPDEIRVPKYSGPTVVLHCAEGCGPCADWWTNKAPIWIEKGWDVKKELYTGPRWTPWYTVFDGVREFEIDGQLNSETYKKAGGR